MLLLASNKLQNWKRKIPLKNNPAIGWLDRANGIEINKQCKLIDICCTVVLLFMPSSLFVTVFAKLACNTNFDIELSQKWRYLFTETTNLAKKRATKMSKTFLPFPWSILLLSFYITALQNSSIILFVIKESNIFKKNYQFAYILT